MSKNELAQNQSTPNFHIEPKVWMGIAAITFTIFLAAGLGNLIGVISPGLTKVEEFAWSHLVPLPIAIVAGLWFIRKAGWTNQVWKSTPSYQEKRRRKWILAFPILLGVQAVVSLATVPWANQSIIFVLISLIAMLLVAINEELYFRGILRFTIQQHHSQTLALVLVSLLFGLAHSFSSFYEGLPIAFIAFQVGATAATGALYFAAFVATGRLWVPILFHFVADFTLRLSSGETSIGPIADVQPSPIFVASEMLLFALLIPFFISTIRHDLSTRKENKAVEKPVL